MSVNLRLKFLKAVAKRLQSQLKDVRVFAERRIALTEFNEAKNSLVYVAIGDCVVIENQIENKSYVLESDVWFTIVVPVSDRQIKEEIREYRADEIINALLEWDYFLETDLQGLDLVALDFARLSPVRFERLSGEHVGLEILFKLTHRNRGEF